MCAHIDVVPVEEESWDVPPFEGRLVDGFIYGRGTLDDKHSLMVSYRNNLSISDQPKGKKVFQK